MDFFLFFILFICQPFHWNTTSRPFNWILSMSALVCVCVRERICSVPSQTEALWSYHSLALKTVKGEYYFYSSEALAVRCAFKVVVIPVIESQPLQYVPVHLPLGGSNHHKENKPPRLFFQFFQCFQFMSLLLSMKIISRAIFYFP